MENAIRPPAEVLSRGGGAQNESVLNILKLISAGSPLPEVLTIIARLVESQREGLFCTIWLRDDKGDYLYCAAAPSLPGFCDHVGHTEICLKGASCGTAVYQGADLCDGHTYRAQLGRLSPLDVALWDSLCVVATLVHQ